MPKLTRKYSAALVVAPREWLPTTYPTEKLYSTLQQAGYLWNSNTGRWESIADEPSDPPTEFIRLRVWSDSEIISEVADDVIRKVKDLGFKLVEQSEPYRCRPPKQFESRIYLTFLPKRKAVKNAN